MKPSQVAAKLRQIASAIDNSNNPRKDLVAADLKRVIAAVSVTPEQKQAIIKTFEEWLEKHAAIPPAELLADELGLSPEEVTEVIGGHVNELLLAHGVK